MRLLSPIRGGVRRFIRASVVATALGGLVGGSVTAADPAEAPASAPTAVSYRDFEATLHGYYERPAQDPFARFRAELDAGRATLDRSSDLAFLKDLLRHLGVPESSQMLVFSTTSLQLRYISPSNPRALYFNEDVYVGYIPGGRIEIASLDPDLGAVFYIFDLPHDASPLQVERSRRCMNCHAGEDTGHVPGLVVKSVAAGSSGGSLDSFRREQTGHGIPLAERFGGWHVTGQGTLTNHWGNALGRFVEEALVKIPNPPGARFSFDKYLVRTSDLAAQLLHEHQVGFVNRAVEATYRARVLLGKPEAQWTPEERTEVDRQVRVLARYLLFADEVPLPKGGLDPDPAFRADFQSTRRAIDGRSLKDLDLETRLLRHRCSYMIYSAAFRGLPHLLKDPLLRRLRTALDPNRADSEFAYLPIEERQVLTRILRGTVEGF